MKLLSGFFLGLVLVLISACTTMSVEEAQMRASGDPRGAELIDLKAKFGRMKAQASAAMRAMAQAKFDKGTLANKIASLTKAAERINADFEKLGPTLAGAFTVTKDAAGRLTKSLDDVTQRSAQLTGITQGLGEVFDALAGQIAGAGGEADKLARGQAVKTWAEQTREVLSYVVDAADVTWQAISVLGRNVYFALESSGRFMAAVGAVYTEVLRGNISGARQIGAELDARDVL